MVPVLTQDENGNSSMIWKSASEATMPKTRPDSALKLSDILDALSGYIKVLEQIDAREDIVLGWSLFRLKIDSNDRKHELPDGPDELCEYVVEYRRIWYTTYKQRGIVLDMSEIDPKLMTECERRIQRRKRVEESNIINSCVFLH
jgi:hypothetical protein